MLYLLNCNIYIYIYIYYTIIVLSVIARSPEDPVGLARADCDHAVYFILYCIMLYYTIVYIHVILYYIVRFKSNYEM